MQTYEVWRSGYSCTGDYSPAEFMGIAKAESFKEACAIVLAGDKYYSRDTGTWWGCKLWDNEISARRAFG